MSDPQPQATNRMGPSWSFGPIEDASNECPDALLAFTNSRAAAKLFATRYAELRQEIQQQRERAEAAERRVNDAEKQVNLFRQTGISVIDLLEKAMSATETTPECGNLQQVRIEELDFSVRTYNCLKKSNIQTLGDLVKWSEEELMNIRNFGRRELRDVKDKLENIGQKLKPFSPQQG